tara:strand:- start:123 stop:524 length:402 start_codon:yes stop_codon:yes gene_type:complete
MSDVNGQKDESKKFIVNGQDVIDFMLGDLGLGFSVDKIVATLEMKVDSDCFTYEEDKENLGKDWDIEVDGWSITIEQRYERGKQNQMLDEDDVFCGLVESEKITFSGDGNDFRKWLEKNWKEVYEVYSWRMEL